MRTIWALIPAYDAAAGAFDELQRQGIDDDHLNVVMKQAVARDQVSQADVARVAQAQATEKRQPGGLDHQLAGRQPMRTPDAGPLIVAGRLAGVLGKAASQIDGSSGGLSGVLIDFSVPAGVAHLYLDGVQKGEILFAVDAPDEKAAAAATILRRAGADQVGDYTG